MKYTNLKILRKNIGRVKALEILLEEKMERSIVRIDTNTKGKPQFIE